MNKRTEQTRWTPKRLLSLLMALIMTLSLLPTAALAAADDYKLTITDYPTGLFVGQTSGNIKATLTAKPSAAAKNVRLKITVTQTLPSGSIINPGDCTILYQDVPSGTYTAIATIADAAAGTITGYLDADSGSSLAPGGTVSATFTLKFNKSGYYSYTVKPFEWDATTGEGNPLDTSHAIGANVEDSIESLTVDPVDPEVGQPFTVRAGTAFNSGHVAFTYNGDTKSVPVSPLPDNKGYAEYTFIADAAATGLDTISATLFGVAGISDATKTATVNVGTPAAYHTVTFHENAAGVYNMPAPQPVVSGGYAVEPTVKPQRDGYTFDGWHTDAACTAAYNFTATAVNADTELYAKWTATPVTIEITKDTADVTVFPPPTPSSTTSTLSGAIGKTANFNVTVPAKYDTANMIVQAGPYDGEHQYLVPELQSTDATGSVTFHYQLLVTEDIVVDEGGVLKVPVHVGVVTEKTFTVMMPTGHFNAEITGVDTAGSTAATDKKSASIVYDGSYTFTVTPDTGYDVAVYVNGVAQTATGNSYTVTDVTGPQRVEVVESAIPNYNVTFTVPLSGQFFTQSVTRGGNASKPGVDPEREGYKFDGWYTEAQYKNENGTSFDFTNTTINADTVLYGKLTPKTYTIKYDLNGGNDTITPATIAAQPKTHGTATKLSDTVPTRESYTFLGWGTTATATAASYQPGDMYSVDGDITLYAVWKENTYTVTLPTGQGYSISTEQSTTVTHGGNFEFTVTVAREYAQKDPTVTVNGGGTLSTPTRTPNGDQSVSYTYTISGITADQIVSVSVSQNLMFTVTFEAPAGTFYREQQVEQGSIATRPADPEVEGYTFGGWYKNTGWDATDKWDFATDKVTDNTTLYAKLDLITPQITWPTTTTGYTMKVEYTKPGGTTAMELTTNPGTVPYKSVVTFTIKIDEGYDASKMLVGLNGVLFSPKDITGDTYTYEFIAKADTKITVAGIERKTVTVIYNANARDDVSGLPSPQVVKYYLAALGEIGNDKITTQVPSRTGYTFLGWNTDSEAKEADARYTAEKIRAGAASEFTQDTTLYAIWKAQDTTLTLKITDVAYDTQQNDRVIQYEGESITLQATLNHFAVGSVTFYKSSTKEANKTNSTIVGSTSIEGTTATFRTTVGEYKTTAKDEYYWAEFTPNADEGYSGSTSGVMNVGIFSKALSWKITKGTSNVADNGNVLNVYEGDSATGTPITGNMVAGHTYTLQVKTASITGVETLDSKQPVLGKDYKIVWQYTEVGKNDWKTDGEASDKATYLVTGDKSGYQFRAQIVPLGPDNGSLFVKAGKFENDALVNNQYDTCLYTKSTDTTVRQATATTLTITGAETESKDVWVNGATDKFGRDHLAQFEEQTVTLTANIVDNTTKGAVADGGKVYFYRYVDGKSDTKLNETAVVVNNGVAELTNVKISKYNPEIGVTSNLDKFYAVYETNETYETSASVAKEGDTYKSPADPLKDMVFIKSASLQTPVIMSEKPGMLAGHTANETTYLSPLTDLLAGISHTFTLKATAGSKDATANYSVVALDGRTVDATNYDIEWQYKTGANFDKAGNVSAAEKYITTTTKVDDRYRVKLTGKGVFAGSEATSKDAVIGTKQDVTVTVKAIDAITKTPETDVYQLNEITLTATVAAANDKPTMQPTGTVTFYYLEEGATNKWIELGTSTLTKNAQSTQGEMIATIQTTKLPVAKTTYTSLPSKITAVYSGDDTFQQNQTFTKDTASTKDLVFGTIANVNGNTTNDVEVTVRSSVVKGCADANKAVTTLSDTGIHISADGLAAHEGLVTLKLDEVYTLDAKKAYSKLLAGTDYTVQWQILSGASAHNNGGDYSSADAWVNIDGATGTTYTLTTVEQDAAYRAVITVANEPITKGSFTEIEQDANALLNGHKQYYSNVLCAADGQTTIDVLIDTNGRGTNKEGITEGETVNVNVFLSGATQATPIADVTVKIENDTAKGNNETYSTTLTGSTVNGWNVFPWNTVGVAPGFYKVTVSSKSNTGYADETVTRSLIVRESSYTIAPSNTTVTYNGRTQGLTVALNGFGFNGTGINEAANKSWTVKYYDKGNNLVEPTQAGTYRAVVTLPASAYWTEQTKTVDFTIKQRSVSIADAIAQAKVYDGTTNVSIVEVMLNDAVTDQTTNGTGLPTNNVGIINGDSIYAVATEAKLSSANAGDNSFTISTIDLRGDDAANYVWDGTAAYTEDIYVSRSQVYGEHGTLELKQGETFPADKVIKMIDQSGREITLGTGTEDYTLTFYYHSDTKIEKTTDISKLGLYTVVARPNQSNYKSGVTMQFNVVETATNLTEAATPKPSTLITISNTAELYGAAENKGIQTSFTNGATLTKLEYQAGTGWMTDRPTSAGRYLVKVTASTGDVAYGIYTITKAHPSIDVTPATGLTYNSMPQNGYTTLTGVEGKDASKDYYITYAGDVAIGYNTPADGNVDEQAPVDAGEYAVTLHVNETANYTAHEISKSFTIAKKALTIKAKHVGAWQYGSMPGFYASYEGLAGDVNDSTPDTSLRDVQIAPELLFNPTSNNQSNYSNDALDQVGKIIIRPVDALSKNYEQTPVDGEFTKNEEDPKPTLTILGLPQNGKSADVTVYYGDEIQLSAYGNYLARRNTSSFLKWEITNSTLTNGSVSIDENNILHVNGVGTFTVKLTRGTARQAIKTEINVTAIQKEAKIALKNVDKVYNGASQTYAYEGNVTVHDELYQALPYFDATKVTRTNTDRIDVGTQITTAKVTGAWAYQSETYGGKFTINDKEATVAPVAQSTVYGTLETFDTTPTYKVDGKAGSVDPVTGVNVASQTDAYNRLDVHDGYEILVAGTEDMNYNVKYTTDHNDTAKNAEDSAVTTYQDVVFTSKTDKYLNDATIYGETPNVLDWTLVNVIGTTRDSVDYADNLADFDLPDTFVEQDKDDCTGNKVTYKAANRTTDAADSSNIRYNQDKLEGPRTSTDTNTDENYTLKFNTVKNSGAANYKLTNEKTGNSEATTNALTANSKGFIIPATGESNDVSGENFVEGSANIAQRPIKLEKAVTDAQLYWRLPQSQLYTALVNVLKAEENSVGRGLAKGHTIEDLDLSFTIGSTPVDKNNDQPMNFTDTGKETVTVTVGDTNYKLEGSNTFEVDFQTMRIRATYYNKTFTGFDVRIEKIDAAGNSVGPLDSTKGLTFKVLKQTNGVLDTETDYAANKSFTFVSKDGTYGYFHGSYSPLPLLGNGELYVFQMYEYGVPLERK